MTTLNTWQLQEAKAHLSQVIKQAISKGPQNITLRGEPAVVVISRQEFEKLSKPKASFVQFINNSPLKNSHVDLSRNRSTTRKVNL
jgi:antitoxin Phd